MCLTFARKRLANTDSLALIETPVRIASLRMGQLEYGFCLAMAALDGKHQINRIFT
jgi:hypothetical protein